MVDPVTVLCQECGRELAGDSPDLQLELTCDDQLITYCERCWQREFGAVEVAFPEGDPLI